MVYNTLGGLAVGVQLPTAAGPQALLPSYRMGRCSSPGIPKDLHSCFYFLGSTALTASPLPALSMARGGHSQSVRVPVGFFSACPSGSRLG